MTDSQDFDVDSVLERLRAMSEKFQAGSSEEQALRVAAVALIYVRETQRLEDYRGFFRKFSTPATESIVPSHAFATREKADAWLASGKARQGDLVTIAGEGFRVIPKRDATGLRFRPTPLPEELMKMGAPESK